MSVGDNKCILEKNLDRLDKFLYLERYVNNGSPSGFTFINETSVGTRPYDNVKSILIYKIKIKKPYESTIYGQYDAKTEEGEIYIHPDLLEKYQPFIESYSTLEAIPLASMRTVYVPSLDVFMKLQYDNVLGRIDRVINNVRANHSYAINTLLLKEYSKNKNQFFLPEPRSEVIEFDGKSIGITYRLPIKDKMLIPAFSLFGTDRNNPNSRSILSYFLSKRDSNINNYIFNTFLKPAVELFFDLLLNLGLVIEAHAQNIMYVMESNNICGIALRDFESIDKNMDIKSEYNSYFNNNYKCFSKEDKNYLKRNSFMFDYKLGEYLLKPIIKESANNGANEKELINLTKKLVNKYLEKLPHTFFPSNKWYSLENKMIDRTTNERNYIEQNNPLFR